MEIPPFRHHRLRVGARAELVGESGFLPERSHERVAHARMALTRRDRAPDFVGRGGRVDPGTVLREQSQKMGQVLDLVGDDVNDAGRILQFPGHGDEPSAEDRGAEFFERSPARRSIWRAGLVFQRHEDDAVRSARPLAHQH